MGHLAAPHYQLSGAAIIDPIQQSSDFSVCGNGLRLQGEVEDFEGRAEKGEESEDAPPSARVRSVAIVRGAADCRIKSVGKARCWRFSWSGGPLIRARRRGRQAPVMEGRQTPSSIAKGEGARGGEGRPVDNFGDAFVWR